jgi:hypothetical protein
MLHKVPMYDSESGVWCVVRTSRVIEAVSFKYTMKSEKHMEQVPFFKQLINELGMHSPEQDSVTAHRARASKDALTNILGQLLLLLLLLLICGQLFL